MKAPNNIYIDDLAVVNDCVTKISTAPLPNFSEYIRKDFLLKWLNKAKMVANNDGIRAGFQIVIKQIESL